MHAIGDRLSGKTGRRSVAAAAALAATGLILCALPAASGAQDAGNDNAASARQAADEAAGSATTAPAPAGGRAAAVREAITGEIASREREIRSAYYQELRANPGIRGEIAVSFAVRPGGDVADVRVERSSLNWPPLEERILGAVRGWRFPPFDGEPVQATVPYRFGSD